MAAVLNKTDKPVAEDMDVVNQSWPWTNLPSSTHHRRICEDGFPAVLGRYSD